MAKKTAPRNRGQIIERGDRKWLVRVYIGRDGAGKRKYRSQMVSGTFKEAEREMTKLLRGLDTQTLVQPSKQRLADFLDEYLTNRNDIAPKTRVTNEVLMRLYVKPALGHVPLANLTPALLRTLYGSLVSDRKLGPRSVRRVHALLRTALQQAVEDGHLAVNPCDRARGALPRRPQSDSAGRALTPAETMQLLTVNADDPLYALLRVLLTTGLRPQEAVALKWDDLAQDSDGTWCLSVERAEVEISRGEYGVQERTKTASSRRRVPLSETTLAVLQEHRKGQLKAMLKSGAEFSRLGYIFARADGAYLPHYTARRAFKRALKRAGLDTTLRMYDARHTHLTHLLSVTDVKTAAERAGHSSTRTLLSTYAHSLPQAAKAAPGAIEEFLLSGSQKVNRTVNQ